MEMRNRRVKGKVYKWSTYHRKESSIQKQLHSSVAYSFYVRLGFIASYRVENGRIEESLSEYAG
jgi:hypothetical protein